MVKVKNLIQNATTIPSRLHYFVIKNCKTVSHPILLNNLILEKGVKPILNSRCLQTLSVLWFIFLSGSAPHAVFGASLGDLITLYPYTYTVHTIKHKILHIQYAYNINTYCTQKSFSVFDSVKRDP